MPSINLLSWSWLQIFAVIPCSLVVLSLCIQNIFCKITKWLNVRIRKGHKFHAAQPLLFTDVVLSLGEAQRLTLSTEIKEKLNKGSRFTPMPFPKGLVLWIFLICWVMVDLDPGQLVSTSCTRISLDHSPAEKLVCYQREVQLTAFHSSTISFFLLGGTLCPDFLCTRWLPPKGPKAPGISRIPDVLAPVDLGEYYGSSLVAKFSC